MKRFTVSFSSQLYPRALSQILKTSLEAFMFIHNQFNTRFHSIDYIKRTRDMSIGTPSQYARIG